MTKKQLLKMIDQAVETEEHLAAVYANHCTLFEQYLRSGDPTRTQCGEVLAMLRDESRSHRESLGQMYKTVEAAHEKAY